MNCGMVVGERRVAEDMIRMDMRVDDIAHRHRRNALDRAPQRASDRKGAAGVDDRDASAADDKAEVGNVAEIGASHLRLLPVVHVDARRRVFQREFGHLRRRAGGRLRPSDCRAHATGRTRTSAGTAGSARRQPGRVARPSTRS